MARYVTITTPMPTLDELGKELGLTKARQKSLIRLVEKASTRSGFILRKRKASSSKGHKTAGKNGTYPARKKDDRALEASA